MRLDPGRREVAAPRKPPPPRPSCNVERIPEPRSRRLTGLSDPGLIAPALKADINVIDYDRLHLHPPKVHYDLPVGGRRLLQRVDGYDATIVSGVVTRRGGKATGARPGKLVRGAQGSQPKYGAAAS